MWREGEWQGSLGAGLDLISQDPGDMSCLHFLLRVMGSWGHFVLLFRRIFTRSDVCYELSLAALGLTVRSLEEKKMDSSY